MVDVLSADLAPERADEARTESEPEPSAGRDWLRHAPLLLVGFAVAFSAWMLRAELHALPYANDEVVHSAMARFAAERIRAGHSPFDAWFPFLGLGSPQFLQYQGLAHILTGALSIVFGSATFRWTNYLLLSTWPISVYLGARLLGLDRWQAAAAAAFSPTLSNITGYGIEWSSFTWLGSGLWSMLWAIWLLPITLGLAWRAIAYRERVALATFVTGLTCALHFTTGYLVLLALGVFVLVRPSGFLMRLGRAAVVGIGGLLVFAFVFVPMLAGQRFQNITTYQAHTFWVDSFGPGRVIGWLGRGEVFDFGRAPVVSLFAAVGAVACGLRMQRSEAARVPMGLMLLSVLLYSGRRVVGPVIDLLPGGERILLHRYIIGVHFAGLLLAGIGAVAVARAIVAVARRFVPYVRHRPAIPVVLSFAVLAAAFVPLLTSSYNFARMDAYLIGRQAQAQLSAGNDVNQLLDIVRERGHGRVFGGSSNSWGTFVRTYQVPLYTATTNQDADSIGDNLRTDSLSSDIEPAFDEKDQAQYDLLNVKYLLLLSKWKVSVPAKFVAERGAYSLYEVPTSGYLEVVDTTAPIRADNTNMADVMKPYLKSDAVAQLRHPLVAFDGAPTPAPSLDADTPYTGPPGVVSESKTDFVDGRFSGRVHADRDAWVMLKESYYPHWTATVDGKPVKPSMLAPSFVGVPVPKGDHTVVFTYRSTRSYPALLALGALTLLAIACGPIVWRRVRRRRQPEATNA